MLAAGLIAAVIWAFVSLLQIVNVFVGGADMNDISIVITGIVSFTGSIIGFIIVAWQFGVSGKLKELLEKLRDTNKNIGNQIGDTTNTGSITSQIGDTNTYGNLTAQLNRMHSDVAESKEVIKVLKYKTEQEKDEQTRINLLIDGKLSDGIKQGELAAKLLLNQLVEAKQEIENLNKENRNLLKENERLADMLLAKGNEYQQNVQEKIEDRQAGDEWEL